MARTAESRSTGSGPVRAVRTVLLAAPVVGAALVAALLLTGETDVPVHAGDATPVASAGAPPAAAAAEPDGPASYWRTDGHRPEAHPDDRSAVGFVGFGDDLEVVIDLLGPPDDQHLEEQAIVLGDTLVNRWSLDGAEMVVQAFPEQAHPVEFIRLSLEEGSAVRASLWGGVVVGESTLADVAAAWGDDHDRRVLPAHPEAWASADEAVEAYRHTLVWSACAGDVPLLIAVGHHVPAPPGARVGDALPDFDPAVLDSRVTDVWVTWADAEPAHHGCG